MVLVPVTCPYCHSAQVIKGGKTETGKQRYRCQQIDCSHRSFVLDPVYKGRLPQIKEQVIDMALNGSGIRDTARVLKISPTTGSGTLMWEAKAGWFTRCDRLWTGPSALPAAHRYTTAA
jgi:transposase-like protein